MLAHAHKTTTQAAGGTAGGDSETPEYYIGENKSGYYEVRWTAHEGGRSRTRSFSLRTKDRGEAEKRFRSWLTATNLVAPTVAGVSVEALCARYLRDEIDLNGKAKAQHWSLKPVRDRLGPLLVEDLDENEITAYRRARMADGVKSGTIRRELNALKAALSWGRTKGKLIPRDCTPYIELPPDSPPRQDFLDEDEEAMLWERARLKAVGNEPFPRRRVGLFICIALQTAARCEAIRGLTWDRVDLHRRMVDFREPGRRETKKRRIALPISDKLFAVLQDAYARRDPANPYVLGHPGSVHGPFKRFVTECGLAECRIHDLRRTWATLRVQWGMPLEKVAKVLGDTVEVVEKHYAVFQPGYLRDEMNMDRPGARPAGLAVVQ